MSHELSPEERVTHARRAVLAASGNWPPHDSPYDMLITMELTAPQLTYIGSIPGVLLDLEHVRRRDEHHGITADNLEARYDLLAKRQEHLRARMAAGPNNLAASLILWSDFAYHDYTTVGTEDRLGVQVERLQEAQEAGWTLKIVDGANMNRALPPETSILVMAGDPEAPTSVYWEGSPASQAPHETWSMAPEERAWAARTYTDLITKAHPPDNVTIFLEMASDLAALHAPTE